MLVVLVVLAMLGVLGVLGMLVVQAPTRMRVGQTRCEQMEVVLGETLQNRSCITDYELSVLSSVVESLFTWVVDHFVTDLDLDIAIEPLEEEYTRSVRQMESREPLIMEVKLYAIQRIIETASNALMERRYQLEVAMEAERDRRRELEMELKK